MYRTITLGTCVSVQGKVVQRLLDGRLVLQVGSKLISGYPVGSEPEPNPPELRQSA